MRLLLLIMQEIINNARDPGTIPTGVIIYEIITEVLKDSLSERHWPYFLCSMGILMHEMIINNNNA